MPDTDFVEGAGNVASALRLPEKRGVKETGPAPPIRIVLADDHDLVRSGIKALLSTMAGIEVVGEARDGNELVALVESLVPDIVLTDISMPGMDGLEAIAKIHASHPRMRMLVLSMYDTLDFVKRAIANGACGYMMKDTSPAELELALHHVMQTGSYFGLAVAQMILGSAERAVEDDLTARQVEILRLIAAGQSAKEIGHQLKLSSKTIDVHRGKIMERLQLNDIASLTRYAIRKGLILV